MALLTGTNTYVAMTGKVSHQVPLTHACWLKFSSNPVNTEITFQYVWKFTGPGTSLGNFAPHVLNTTGAGFTINTGIQDSSGWTYNITSDGSVVVPLDVWHHVCYTYDNNGTANTFGVQAIGVSGSKMYVDTVLEPNGSPVIPAPPTLLLPPDNPNGCVMFNSGTGTPFVQIAFPAIWLSILTAAEIASLAKGADPRKIQPGKLVSFSLFSGSSAEMLQCPDLKSGVNYNTTPPFSGTDSVVTAFPNPRIYLAA